ncbi:hypothetical protein Pmani_021623 [Petrolisthes manimaculis]|uniref:Transport and Golgi organization protein 2 homolog n=1 Tax=Petrolisthes manimaculis TaxID=1843537 RepID=A0AAE1U5A3_9EUCA|nr:hypothetical protein Pmani_021623 [Petrolisthes manimaculis]
MIALDVLCLRSDVNVSRDVNQVLVTDKPISLVLREPCKLQHILTSTGTAMCLLFCYINPHPQIGQYKLVLVNNRDEQYTRPTKPAHFWDSGILAGMDMKPGTEGGTWLGMVRSGHIGCLLNILQPAGNPQTGKSRGSLVVNYLLSKQGGLECCKRIQESKEKYQPFNLVTLEPAGDSYKMVVYNYEDDQIEQLKPGIHGIGNSSIEKPFLKVRKGCKKFEQIIETHGKVEKEEELMKALEAMMRDDEACFPDPQIIIQGEKNEEQLLKDLSSIYVSHYEYGTRTTTLILVDHTDRVKVQEKTMRQPINTHKPDWDTSRFSFQIVKNDK